MLRVYLIIAAFGKLSSKSFFCEVTIMVSGLLG